MTRTLRLHLPCVLIIASQTDRPTLTIEDVQENPQTLKFFTGIQAKSVSFSELSEDEEHLEAEVGKRKELWIRFCAIGS